MKIAGGIFIALMALSFSTAQAQEAEVQLKEVVVTATKTEKDPKDVTQSVTVITAEEIKESGATTTAEVLERTVGMTITNYGPAGATNTIRIRGADYSRVLVLLDGVRLNSIRDLGFDLSALPVDLSRIERIEIVRGPASALYGSEAVGGVVNIITKEPERSEMSIAATVGSDGYDSTTMGFGSKTGMFSYRLDGTRVTSDGYRPNSDLEQWSYNGRIDTRLSERVSVELLGNYTNKENGLPGPKGTISATDRQWDRIMLASAGVTARPEDGSTLKARASRVDETLQYDSPFLISRHVSSADAAEAQYDRLLGSWNAVSIGFESRRDHLDSSDTGQHASGLKAVFVQDEIAAGESLIVVAGARRDSHSQYGVQTSPKLSARYLVAPTGTILRASYGESFRSPTPNDLYSPYFLCPAAFCGIDIETVGNPNLKPETAKESEAGIEQPMGERSSVKVAGFSRRAENMIIWLRTTPLPTVEHWEPNNIGRATVRGYEAEINLGLTRLAMLEVNYTYTDAFDQSTGLKVPFIPKTQWKGSLTIDMGMRSNLYVEGRSVENYVDPGDPQWRYSVMDVRLVTRLSDTESPNGDLFIGVNNVFDRTYEVARNYPMPPREIRGGVSVRF